MTLEPSRAAAGISLALGATPADGRGGPREADMAQERFRALVAAAPVGMFHADPDGRCTYANPALGVLYGRTPADLLDLGFRTGVALEDRHQLDTLFAECGGADTPSHGELRIIGPDGGHRTAVVRIAAVREGDAVTGFIGTAEDVTVQRALDAYRVREDRLSALGALAAGVAHDFSNMLTVVLGNAALAAQYATSPAAVVTHTGEIQTAAARSRQLVKKILLFGRTEEQAASVVDLVDVVRETYRLLSVTFPSGVLVTLDLPSAELLVSGNGVDLQHALVNLIVNAEHAVRGVGSPALTIRVAARDASDACTAVVEVIDNGVGMSAETQSRIFEPYFTTRGDTDGTGLGLAVVYGVVTRMGGAISVQSAEGTGTVFTLTLPRLAGAQPDVQAVPTHAPHVMVVEDDADLGDAIGRSLERFGHTVTVCTNGMQALRLFQADPGRFDVILADVMMPAMNGYELMAAVHRLRPETGVLLMTGYREALRAPGSATAPVFDVIVKPIVSRDLVLRINDMLAKRPH